MSKIIMFVRYSQILRNAGMAFVAGATDFDTYVKRILDPRRLALREYMFEHVALASLRAQTLPLDPSWFRLYVLTTDWLPEGNRRALEEMLAPYPWAVIASSTPDSSNGWTIERMLGDALTGGDESGVIPYMTLRMDDDDGVCDTFMGHIQRYNKAHLADHIVSFPNGYAGKFDVDRLGFSSFSDMFMPYHSVGMAHVGLFDVSRRRVVSKHGYIFHCGGHTQVWKSHPVITDPSFKAYLKTVFPGQDSEEESLKSLSGRPQLAGETVLESVTFSSSYLQDLWSSEACDLATWISTDPAITLLAARRIQLATRGKRSYLVSHGTGFERIAPDQASSIPFDAQRIRIRLELGFECEGRDRDADAIIFLMQYGSDGVRVANDSKGFPVPDDNAELEATFEVDPRGRGFKVALRLGGVDGVCDIRSAKAFFAAVEEVDPLDRPRFRCGS